MKRIIWFIILLIAVCIIVLFMMMRGEPLPEASAGRTPSEVKQVKPEPEPAVEPEAEPEVEAEATAEVVPEPEPEPVVYPQFDNIRIVYDGSSVIAGRYLPEGTVDVLLDDVSVAQVRAEADGSFVIFVQIDPAPEPRILALQAGGVRSQDTILIEAYMPPQPVAKPEPMIQAEAVEDTQPLPDVMAVDEVEPLPEETPESEQVIDEAESAPAPEKSTEQEPEPQSVPDEVPEEIPLPRVIIANNDGVQVLQSEPAQAVGVDAITYDPDGNVKASGQSKGDAGVVRLYLDNAPLTEAVIDNNTWQADLPPVDSGVYTLRVDEVAPDGEVVSRVETPFKREDSSAVAQALAQDLQSGKRTAVRTVQPGNTLWGIAKDEYGAGIQYIQVFAANKDSIRDPDLIYPGQIFVLPELTE